MRSIRKQPEPREWQEFRSRQGAAYDDVDAPKDILRDALVREQGGLCCYCLARVQAGRERMRIEHWAPQSDNRDRELAYANLLAACPGGERDLEEGRRCDVAKGNRPISLNPADPAVDCSRLFRYLRDGTIEPAAARPSLAQDIEILNLNYARAVGGRRELVAEVLRQVVARGPGVSKAWLEGLADRFDQPNAKGVLTPFCEAASYWLRRQAGKR